MYAKVRLWVMVGLVILAIFIFVPRCHAAPAPAAAAQAEVIQSSNGQTVKINSSINGRWFPQGTIFVKPTRNWMFWQIQNGRYAASAWITPGGYWRPTWIIKGSMVVTNGQWGLEISHFGVCK